MFGAQCQWSLRKWFLLGLAAIFLPAVPWGANLPMSDSQNGSGDHFDTATSVPLPAFEVVTVKPTGSRDGMIEYSYLPDGVLIRGLTTQLLLQEAFAIEPDRIINPPSWAKKDRYDIQAKLAEQDVPRFHNLTLTQRKEMLQPILVDRFKLKFHRETRDLGVYVLAIDKGGVKFRPSETEQDEPDPTGAHTLPRLQVQGTHLQSEGAPIESLTHVLSQDLGSTVVDNTGLHGRYDYTLQWSRDDVSPPAPHSDSSGPSIYTSLQEQLGLKLVKTKAPIEVIVIDHLEKPSAN